MKTWQTLALMYRDQGLKCKEITHKIEYELSLTNMYNKVKCYLYRNKDKVQPVVEEKRIAIQNQEPEYHNAKWDGTETIRFAIMGGWIVTIRVDKNGYIQGFAPELIPYYYSIKDDYKNFSR